MMGPRLRGDDTGKRRDDTQWQISWRSLTTKMAAPFYGAA